MRLIRRILQLGPRAALAKAWTRLLPRWERFPLAFIEADKLFADPEIAEAKQSVEMRAAAASYDALSYDHLFPHRFEGGPLPLRYALVPAKRKALGLVVMFHAHFAPPPLRRWEHFDLLAPQDSFGYMGRGSWFWGENGDDSVARSIAALIAHVMELRGLDRWFGIGSSMGGFGALYHGVRGKADGVYALTPQIDMAEMIARDRVGKTEGPYQNLEGDGYAPDLFAEVAAAESLPALMLLQSQYDHVNDLAHHGLPLAQAWTAKGGWLAMRVYPSAYHLSDGSQREAEAFFRLVVEKLPARL